MINTGSDIIIKDIAGNDKLSLGVSEGFVKTKELMKENSITIQFNLNVMFDFVRGDFLEYEGEKFILRKNYQPEEVDPGQYRYELKFEGTDMQFQDFIMFYTMQGLKEAEWTLTSSAWDFMVIALENIRRYFNDDSFVLGDVIDSDMQNISFDADTVFDALASIAETFECDWYLAGKTLSLVSKYEYGYPVVLEHEVAISDITRSNDNDAEYCTRLYALGSTRNIPKNYRTTGSCEAVDSIVQKRLRLPVSNGDYIDAIPNMKQSEILERVVRFDDIYPRRVGTITELRSIDRTEDENNPFIVYFFKDSGLEFKLDYILPGETLMITFESGWLQGRDFELAYDEKTEEFEIIVDTSIENMNIPNDILKPRVGDEYVIYNFDISLVSDQYIPEAEEELLEKATKWLKGITEDNATYECPNVPGYCYQNGIDLDIGQRVQMVSPIFMDGNKTSRIYGYTKSLFNKYICTYLVGDTSKYSRLANIEKNINETKTMADVQYRETSKSIRALNYLRTAMENETVIDKGMILTTLLRLGAKAGNEWKEHAGVSGIYEEEDDIAFWAGGTLDQAVNLVENPDATFDVAKFVATMGGLVIMNNAIVKGVITALSGKIGGFDISGTSLVNTGFDNDASVIFRNDLHKVFAGIGGNVLPASSGARGVARFENHDKDDWFGLGFTNYAAIISARNALNNVAIQLNGGYIERFAEKVQVISQTSTIGIGSTCVICLNTEEITLTLPEVQFYDDGHVIEIKNLNGGRVNIKPGKGYQIRFDSETGQYVTEEKDTYMHTDDGTTNTADNPYALQSRGDASRFVYSRSINNGTQYGCWVQFKNPRAW